MVVDGRPHLAFEEKILYRDPEESDEDDAVTREVPVDPMSLAPRIAEAFRFLDLEPTDVAYVDAGYGPMFKGELLFAARTAFPEWLEEPNRVNRQRIPTPFPVLASGHVGMIGMVGVRFVPFHEIAPGVHVLPREVVDALDASVASGACRIHRDGEFEASVSSDGEWTFRGRLRNGMRFDHRTRRAEFADFWGERQIGWEAPFGLLMPSRTFRTDFPVRAGGEPTTTPAFADLDAQYGMDAPWSLRDEPTPSPF